MKLVPRIYQVLWYIAICLPIHCAEQDALTTTNNNHEPALVVAHAHDDLEIITKAGRGIFSNLVVNDYVTIEGPLVVKENVRCGGNLEIGGTIIAHSTQTYNQTIVGSLQVLHNQTIGNNLTISSLLPGVVQADASGTLSSSKGTNGQLLIGATNMLPSWANLTSSGATVTITNTPHGINLEATNSAGFIATVNGNTGSATASGGAINLVGDTTSITTTGSGATLTAGLVTNPVVAGSLTATNGLTAVNGTLQATHGNIAAPDGSVTAGGSITAGSTITAGTGLTVTSGGITTTGSSTFTGNLNLAAQSELHLQDATGGEYVGLRAPATIPASYLLTMPVTTPTARQLLQANSTTPTSLEWITPGGSQLPATSRTIYVATFGNDTTGDGSFTNPYASFSKAVTVANSLSTSNNPVGIVIASGTYIENNSTGPLAITAAGVSVQGSSATSTVLVPNTLSNTFITTTSGTRFIELSLVATGVSTAPALSFVGTGNTSSTNSIRIVNFNTGIACAGTNSTYVLANSVLLQNGTGLAVDSTTVSCNNIIIQGSATTTPANTGISATGSLALISYNSSVCQNCATALSVSNNALATVRATSFRNNTIGLHQESGSRGQLSGCSFQANRTNGFGVQASGTGTMTEILSCFFDGRDSNGIAQGTAVSCTTSSQIKISGGAIGYYITALAAGTSGDSSATSLTANALAITNCTHDIVQDGAATLVIQAATADSDKITINDSTNATLAFFDNQNNNTLDIGNFSDTDTNLLQTSIGSLNSPEFNYKASLYASKALGYENPNSGASTLFALAHDATGVAAITTDRTKTTALRLASDTASPTGTTNALRSWDITKKATTAELAFNYQNSDSSGQDPIALFTLMQLDGVNNQLQLPTAGTKIVFSGDTNLYRSATDTLKTDDTFAIGSLTANRAVATGNNSELSSSPTTATQLNYLSTTTSNVQDQLDAKVAKAGDTMTGVLQLPAGSAASPSLRFTASPTTGLSTPTVNKLSLGTSGIERLSISAAGTVAISDAAGGFTTAGVVHNDASGNLSSSFITNSDIDANAAIADSKLATISTPEKVLNSATSADSANTANAIVARDNSGNFSAGTITATALIGTASGNLPLTGGTLSGALRLPAGTAAAPALTFTGSPTTGLSAAVTHTLSLNTAGESRLQVDPTGTITIPALNSDGVVHTDANGVLSTGLVVNNDIANTTITNAKLATVSSANNPQYLVARNALGSFSATMIQISGVVTSDTDVATKAYVDAVAGLGLEVKEPALAVSITNITLSGTQTIDDVALVANNRVLLTGQTNPVENGLWLVQVGAWTRPTDFSNGTNAGQAYVLITSGTVYAGTSWLCSTPTAIIGTDPISFAQFSLPSQTTAANVGAGAGQIFRDKTGNTLNLKTISAGAHVIVTNNTNTVNLATDATASNTPNTIVARDNSGECDIETINGSLNGAASLNVLKNGDSMSGALNMLTQNELRFQDANGGEYVGLQAPSTVNASYTVALPPSAPTASQVLRASSSTPTNLTWVTSGEVVTPATSRMIYVTKYGNDTTGDGSFGMPYATLSKAISIANGISTAINPVGILMSSGLYTENNSAGPLTITAAGISIIGDSTNSVLVAPNTLANDLIISTASTRFFELTFIVPVGTSTAKGITLAGTNSTSTMSGLRILNFATGLSCAGTNGTYVITNTQLGNNGIGLSVDSATINCLNVFAIGSATTTPANTGVVITGASSVVAFTSSICQTCTTGISITNGALFTARATGFRNNTNDAVLASGAIGQFSGCTFQLNPTAPIDVQASGVGTAIKMLNCYFNGKDSSGLPRGIAVKVTGEATGTINGGFIEGYDTALELGTLGTASDTSSTSLTTTGLEIAACTNDIVQSGSTTLQFQTSTASASKIHIDDSTNVTMSFFDRDTDSALNIGNFSNENFTLLVASTGASMDPLINYKASLYNTKAIGYQNPDTDAASLFAVGNHDVTISGVTTDRSKTVGLRLVSDTASPIGSSDALRGWDIAKHASTAQLDFQYQNSDASGQAPVAAYTLMQLDGVSNQLQLPTANTKLVFASDTNLYRSAANTLKTDDTFIVETLTANRAVATGSNSELTSSATTATQLGYLSSTTSDVQNQLNAKVAKGGDTMTGALQLPAGSAAAPSLRFTGSTTTGLSAATANKLSFDTNATERMTISSAGTVAILDASNGFATAGVVHNDSSGNLSSSFISNSDIDANAGIVDTKLNTLSTPGKVANSATTATSAKTASAIVARDSSGDFAARNITADLLGNATTATTATNFSGNLAGDTSGPQNATVVNTVGGQTAANIATATTLANAATSSNSPNSLVKRDGSGNFQAGTLTAETGVTVTTGDITIAAGALTASGALTSSGGNITAQTGNIVATAGALVAGTSVTAGTNMTVSAGSLTVPAGATTSPSLKFAGSTNTGISAPTTNSLAFSTNGTSRLGISSVGQVTIPALSTVGVMHNDASGNVSTSLIVNADVDAAAGIVDTKLATISTAGKVSNSATTATSANTASAIVARDGSGVVAVSTLNATTAVSAPTFTGSLTGAASLNVLKSGDTMTGTLTHPAGTAATPSIQFTGSTNTGISAATANTLSFDTNAVERMSISTAAVSVLLPLIRTNITCEQGVQTFNATGNNQSVVTTAGISILLLTHTAARTGLTVNFPPNPTNGQLFTIALATTQSITMTNTGGTGGATIVNGITGLNPAVAPAAAANGAAVTYYYNSTNNAWYRYGRA